ncbi:BTAD domain-containing putative transcriptional regulator [Streptomyces sp. AC602_WCS936]|uniref:AfsR/SARP family transcriptional regulator n=1 Tax=Streptomyces sp. AC602_WCS936 TaxID=2823685 RepID=UPI001C27F9BF|nr:BTAD domain-containing putative transcriptional regulator [Streptomyces sp. AC602_WCS936]
MQFRMLGPLQLHDDKRRTVTTPTSPKQQQLLKALLARPGALVPTADLVRELWGARPPAKAGNALQAHASRLRQTMSRAEPGGCGAARLVARDCGYLLRVRPEELDSARFRLGVHRARALVGTDPEEAGLLLRQALGQWRGAALAGPRGPIGAALAVVLEQERLGALEAVFDLALHTGQHRRIVPELREAVLAHPARTRFREQLSRAMAGPRGPVPAGTGRTLRPVRTAPGGAVQAGAGHGGAGQVGAGHRGTGQGGELDRLRALVDRIASDQHALQSAIAQLSELVGRTAA